MKEGVPPSKIDKLRRFVEVSRETTEKIHRGSGTDMNNTGSKKQIIYRNIKEARSVKKLEESYQDGWTHTDSDLVNGYQAFGKVFENVIPKYYKNIREYIEKKLETKEGSVVLLELGGVASNLSRDFTTGFLKKSAGVSLTDLRRSESRKNSDNIFHHKVIIGNIFSEETRKKIENWLREDKVDIIFEKMGGALRSIPSHPTQWIDELRWIYKLSSDRAIFFLQIAYKENNQYPPIVSAKIIKPWIKMIERKFEGKLEVAWDGNVMRITKLEGAPEELPELDIIP
ncbi:MAG: hypothetical protein KGL67_03360 [Patescibacteria group bacterium]|nr:hypothetical protein [Patescibacteria group bacterium]